MHSKFVKSVLPASPEAGMKKQDILDKRAGADEEITATTLDRALSWLVKQGDVGEKQLMDHRGKPKVYWLAYKPSGGVDGGGFIYSHQTPPPNGGNKPENEKGPRSGAAVDPVTALFEDPPGWLAKQLPLCREDPGRFLKSTCANVSTAAYSTATRWEEVEPVLRRWLEEGGE